MKFLDLFNSLGMGFAALRRTGRSAPLYLLLAVVLPFLLFSIHEHATFRRLAVLVVETNYVYTSSSTWWTLLSLFLIAAFAIGTFLFALWNAALTPSRDGALEEVMYGAVASLFSVLTAVLIYLACTVPLGVAFALIIGAMIGDGGLMSATPGAVGKLAIAGQLFGFLVMAILLWVNARFSLSGPLMAAKGSLNPFAGLAESWRLTAGAWQWWIILYLLIVQIAGAILMGLVMWGSYTLALGSPEGSATDYGISLIWAMYWLAIVFAFTIVPLGMVRLIRGDVEADVSVFE